MGRGASSLLLAAFLLAGCLGGGDHKPVVSVSALERLVLQPADVGREYVRFDEGRQALSDERSGSRSDPKRFGREGGWKARYRLPATMKPTGALVIESLVDAFRSSDGAKEELAAYREDAAAVATGVRLLAKPKLGEDAFALTYLQGSGPQAVRYYVVAWRHANMTASLSVSGFERSLTERLTLDLARAQEAHIASAVRTAS